MSDLVLFDYASLSPDTAKLAKESAIEIKAREKAIWENIIAIGNKLIEVKNALKHGEFEEWVSKEFGWDKYTPSRYIKIAEEAKGKLHYSTIFPNSFKALYALASGLANADEETKEEILTAVEAKTEEKGKALTEKEIKEITEPYLKQIEQLKAKNNELEIIFESQQTIKSFFETEKEKIENDLKEKEDKLYELTKDNEKWKVEALTKEQQLEIEKLKLEKQLAEKYQAEINSLKELNLTYLSSVNQKDAELAILKDSNEKLKTELDLKTTELTDINSSLESTKKELENWLKNPDPESKEKILALQKEVKELETKQSKLTNNLAKIEEDLKSGTSLYDFQLQASTALSRLVTSVEEAISKNVDAFKYLTAEKKTKEIVEKANYVASFFEGYAKLIKESTLTQSSSVEYLDVDSKEVA